MGLGIPMVARAWTKATRPMEILMDRHLEKALTKATVAKAGVQILMQIRMEKGTVAILMEKGMVEKGMVKILMQILMEKGIAQILMAVTRAVMVRTHGAARVAKILGVAWAERIHGLTVAERVAMVRTHGVAKIHMEAKTHGEAKAEEVVIHMGKAAAIHMGKVVVAMAMKILTEKVEAAAMHTGQEAARSVTRTMTVLMTVLTVEGVICLQGGAAHLHATMDVATVDMRLQGIQRVGRGPTPTTDMGSERSPPALATPNDGKPVS